MNQELLSERTTYKPPAVTYHGRVDELTLGDHLELGVHAFQMAAAFTTSVIVQNTPGENAGGGGGGGGGTNQAPPADLGSTPGGGDSLPGSGTSPGEATGTGTSVEPNGVAADDLTSPAGTSPVADNSGSGDVAGVASSSDGDKLPFTGFAVALVAGVGAAAASGGAVLRRVSRRRPS